MRASGARTKRRWRKAGWGIASVRAEIGPASVAAAVASFGAYALVLAALDRAPAASVAAVRETSVLFAVTLGAVVLKERVTRVRVFGAALIVVGVAFVATA